MNDLLVQFHFTANSNLNADQKNSLPRDVRALHGDAISEGYAVSRTFQRQHERGDLLAKSTRTPEETRRLDQLEKDLVAGNTKFERFLGELPQRFSPKPVALQDLRETAGIMEDLRELPPGTVAIFTLVGEDKFRAILRTRCAEGL